MRALRVNHMSLSAPDLEASVRFYVELFGAEPIATPRFPESDVRWLQLGEQQLHLFAHDVPGPRYHHMGLDVDDFEAVLIKARELGVLDTGTFASGGMRRLVDGAVQMY